MSKIFNFCAGPAMLPEAVMQQAQSEFLDWQHKGCSVMEVSHRSKGFIALAEQAEQDLRDLLNVPANYQVLFSHGGGRGQFSAVPLNLSKRGDSADFLNTGAWSVGAIEEAKKYLSVQECARSILVDGKVVVPSQSDWQTNPEAAYLHYCPNETVDGVEIDWVPQTGNVPLVADMSSTILSKPIDVSQFGVIYAGAQKNIGPSGLSVVIVRDDLLDRARSDIPSILHYATLAKSGSMYNTPPTYAWYLAGLVFKWLKDQGGVEAMAEHNRAKADLLYKCIDHTEFYGNQVHPDYRSRMNVGFHLADKSLDQRFLLEAEQAGLSALKGHRIVGGMRASIYNAMPIEGVHALTEFMMDFARNNG
ncbi:MAG: phosphoserine aminotransferase [Paraglaciecola sp.]|jgi:phosphoserine aminotransferase